jgi:ferric-dicitrate binding protein FerR (iron transport regulator)
VTVADLEALFNRIADGLSAEEDERCLAELLRSDPAARRAYREFMGLHSALHWDYAAAALPETPPLPAVPAPPPARFSRASWLAAFAAGALVASAALVGFFLLRPAPPATERAGPEQAAPTRPDAPKADAVAALLVDCAGAEFAPGRGPDGVRFGLGDYELVKGIVHLRFAQGADMVLAAPTRIEVTDAQHTRLVSGKVRVVAPPTAKGFTVATRAANYVDLGTEFGLRVDATSGASDLYVFDGQVNVIDPRSGGPPRPVLTGQSSRTMDGPHADAPPLKEGDFPTPGSIGLKRWEQYEQRMREDRTLLAFYPFRRQPDDEKVLVNAVGEMGNGLVFDARWTTGRWPGKEALLFDRDTDFARVTIPGEHRDLTIAAWVKVDRIDYVLNAILNSDGYEPGGIHFQLNRQGFARGGLVVPGWHQDTFEGKPVPLGSWVHVASVISARTRTQHIYVNGARARERHWQSDVPLKPGSCRVGNWLPDPKDKFPTRALRGQIDELAVWGRALSAEEVGRLVEAGRPGLLWSKE